MYSGVGRIRPVRLTGTHVLKCRLPEAEQYVLRTLIGSSVGCRIRNATSDLSLADEPEWNEMRTRPRGRNGWANSRGCLEPRAAAASASRRERASVPCLHSHGVFTLLTPVAEAQSIRVRSALKRARKFLG